MKGEGKYLWCAAASMALMLGVAAAGLHNNLLNHDVAAQLSLAERALDGLPVNDPLAPREPPFALFVYAVPVLLHRLIPIVDLSQSMFLVTAAIAFGAIALCHRIAQEARLWDRPAGLYAGLTLIFAGFTILPMAMNFHIFGLREHLNVMLCAPYFFSMIVRLSGRPQRRLLSFTVGLLAIPGFMVKPILSVLFMASELALMIQRRQLFAWWRIDSLMICCAGMAYMFLWRTYYPIYFTDVNHYVDVVFGFQSYNILLDRTRILLILTITILAGNFLYLRNVRVPAVDLGIVLVGASIFLFVVQRRYLSPQTFLPCFFIIFLAALSIGRSRWPHTLLLTVIAALLLDLPRVTSHALDPRKAKEMSAAAATLRPYIHDQRATIISQTIIPWPIVTLAGAKFDGPVRSFLALEPILQRVGTIDLDDSQLPPSKIYFRDQFGRFMKERRPEWVVVFNQRGIIVPGKVDMLTYLKHNADFRQEWSHYCLVIAEKAEPTIVGVFYMSLYRRADPLTRARCR